MNHKKIVAIVTLILIFSSILLIKKRGSTALPLIAIANYGPHSSLHASIDGIKAELAQHGFVEHKTVRYEIADVGFEASLIPQMITNLKLMNPRLMIVLTTPVAQCAKGAIRDIPLIYCAITDPVEAGLIQDPTRADGMMTGSSDRQDLSVLLNFARQLLPQARRVGLMYATAESNDRALVRMMEETVKHMEMELVAIPVDQARDIPTRMTQFRDKVDLIYVGSSGPIQPALPVIAAQADAMGIPVFNVDEVSVHEGGVLASFGVDYHRVGANAGQLAVRLLKGESIEHVTPLFPTSEDHHGFISKKKADALGLILPEALVRVHIIEPGHVTAE